MKLIKQQPVCRPIYFEECDASYDFYFHECSLRNNFIFVFLVQHLYYFPAEGEEVTSKTGSVLYLALKIQFIIVNYFILKCPPLISSLGKIHWRVSSHGSPLVLCSIGKSYSLQWISLS